MKMDELIRNALAAAKAEGIVIEGAPPDDDTLLVGLLAREPGAPLAQVEQLQAQVATLQRMQRRQAAEAFADAMVRDRRAVAGQRDLLVGEHLQAAEDDAAHPIAADESAATKPLTRVARLEASYASRPQHLLSGEHVGNQPLVALANNAAADPAADKRRLLKLTAVGRQALVMQGGR